ncbi:MAG: hypothetical protein P4L42_17510 [Desulfocapsaceae bacterium]|nr:hypothetical protein [Desulfocapsaceae bacterium]
MTYRGNAENALSEGKGDRTLFSAEAARLRRDGDRSSFTPFALLDTCGA